MTEQKEVLFKTGKFLGKELKGEGISKTGKPWKRIGLKFAINENQNIYKLNFSCFSPLPKGKSGTGLQPEELIEGNEYTVGFNEETRQLTDGSGTYQARQAFFISHPAQTPNQSQTLEQMKKEADDKYNVIPINTMPKEEIKTFEQEIQEFMQIYKDNTPIDKRHPSHFIGAFMRSKNINKPVLDMLMAAYEKI